MASSLSHIRLLLVQILEKDKLDTAWFDVILNLAQRICAEVKVDVQAKDLMDIRQYVHVKRLPGGSRQECEIIHGTVCTKHPTHKKMLSDLSSPKILLLGAAVEYQRVENKFVSLESVILQEREFLKNCVSKLTAKKPDVLIVEKTVARIAQEFMQAHGMTLVINTKPLVLARIRRCTGASLEESIEQAAQATLGTCQRLHFKVFQLQGGYSKTLMIIEGCPPELGCSVFLRGDSLLKLTKVKRCLLLIVYALYHSRLEAAYLFDSFALPIRDDQELLSPSIEDSTHSDLTSSFFDRVPHPDMGEKSGKRDGTSENQDKSVTSSIRSAVQKLMKSQEAKNRDKGKEADTQDDVGKPLDNPDRQVAMPTNDSVVKVPDPKKTNSLDTAISIQGESVDDKQLTKAGTELKIPVVEMGNDLSRTETRGMAEEATQMGSGEEYSVSPGSEVFEVESRIIPFTALTTITGEPVAVGFTLATPVKLEPFQRTLKTVKLSSSPHLVEEPPYLETKRGRSTSSMRYLCGRLFSSPKLSDEDGSEVQTPGGDLANTADLGEESSKSEIEEDPLFYQSLDRCTKPSQEVCLTTPHPFLDPHNIMDKDRLARLLADFRARGGRLVPKYPKRHRSAEIIVDNSDFGGTEDIFSGSHTLPSHFRGGQSCQPMSGEDSSNRPIRKKREMDCLDAYNHQRLMMQFSSFSLASDNAPNYCIAPRTIQMEFYSHNDLTLGHFLDKFCFNINYTCRNRDCDVPMLQHIRRFIHHDSCVEIIVRVLDQPVVEGTDEILVWNWCRRCLERLPYQTLSKEAWQMSFSKFLELRFYARDYTSRVNVANCGHSLHRNHNQYFSIGRVVATFKYHTINVCEVVFPPPTLPEQQPFIMFPDHEKELSNVNVRGTNLLLSICANITNLTNTMESCPFLEDKRAEFSGMYEDHQMLFKKHLIGLNDMVEQLVSWTGGDDDKERRDKELQLQDAFMNARRALAQIAMAWDMRFEEFLQQEKERKRREQGRSKKGIEDDSTKIISSSFSEENEPEALPIEVPPSDVVPHVEVVSPSYNTEPFTPDISIEGEAQSAELVAMATKEKPETSAGTATRSSWPKLNPALDVPAMETATPAVAVPSPSRGDTLECPLTLGDNLSLSSATSSLDLNELAHSLPTKSSDQPPVVSRDPHQTQKRKRNMFQNWISEKTAPVKLDMPFPPDEHYMLPLCDIPSIVIFDKEPSSIIAYTLSSEKYKEELHSLERDQEAQMASIPSGRSSPAGTMKAADRFSNDKESSKSRNTMLKNPKKMLNLIWKKGSSSPTPMAPSEINCTVNDGQPETTFSGNTEVRDETDLEFSKSTAKDSTTPSIVCEFTDPAHSQFWCQVYYPSEFARLRQVLFPSGEEVYIRCLSRCKSWKATGGKSGSKFSKTEDDRFILKEIQRTESDFFLQFAPHYIKHMESAVNNNRPTVLTKIFGFYTIVCKNPITNSATKQHIIVMENLFYKRHISKVFDLKGSIRNRHVKTPRSTEDENHVLMDENLIKEMVKSPLYIRLHNKSILDHALDADTKLLARHFVMDYSLLVGIDRNGKELVIGIIDFIRKFTFDKKLEMIVKSSGIVGGHGKPPTILSPELYRTRFCEAMNKYFVLVPDRWNGLGKDYYQPKKK